MNVNGLSAISSLQWKSLKSTYFRLSLRNCFFCYLKSQLVPFKFKNYISVVQCLMKAYGLMPLLAPLKQRWTIPLSGSRPPAIEIVAVKSAPLRFLHGFKKLSPVCPLLTKIGMISSISLACEFVAIWIYMPHYFVTRL